MWLVGRDCPAARAGSERGHGRVVDVNQALARRLLPVDLRFPPVGVNKTSVLPEPGGKIPIKFRPSCVAVNVDGNIARSQLPFGRHPAHQPPVDILLNLLKVVLIAERMNEGNPGGLRPDLRCECGVRGVNRPRVPGDQRSFDCECQPAANRERILPSPAN